MAYDCKSNKWTYIASMNKSRGHTSSAVFQGKVVVTGSKINRQLDTIFSSRYSKSVEAYCFHENKWTQLPDMLIARCGHGSVSIGNKLFVIANEVGNKSEVFDSMTNKFTFIKRISLMKNVNYFLSTITIGYKIYVFKVKYFEENEKVSIFCYNVNQNSWTSEEIYNAKCSDYFSCEKVFKH